MRFKFDDDGLALESADGGKTWQRPTPPATLVEVAHELAVERDRATSRLAHVEAWAKARIAELESELAGAYAQLAREQATGVALHHQRDAVLELATRDAPVTIDRDLAEPWLRRRTPIEKRREAVHDSGWVYHYDGCRFLRFSINRSHSQHVEGIPAGLYSVSIVDVERRTPDVDGVGGDEA